jgi:hypothetical protein
MKHCVTVCTEFAYFNTGFGLRAFVNTIKKLRVSKKGEKFLDQLNDYQLSRRILND